MRHNRRKSRVVRPVVAQLGEARSARDTMDDPCSVRADARVGTQHRATTLIHRKVPLVLAVRVAVRVHVDAASVARRERQWRGRRGGRWAGGRRGRRRGRWWAWWVETQVGVAANCAEPLARVTAAATTARVGFAAAAVIAVNARLAALFPWRAARVIAAARVGVAALVRRPAAPIVARSLEEPVFVIALQLAPNKGLRPARVPREARNERRAGRR